MSGFARHTAEKDSSSGHRQGFLARDYVGSRSVPDTGPLSQGTVLQRKPNCACGGECPSCEAMPAYNVGSRSDARSDRPQISSAGGLRLQRQTVPASSKPPCREVGDPNTEQGAIRAYCLSDAIRNDPSDCEFTDSQIRMLNKAMREATSRVRRALGVAEGGVKDQGKATALAAQVFASDTPSISETQTRLRTVFDFVKNLQPENFSGKGCSERMCNTGAATAFVIGTGTLPIYVCPLGLATGQSIYKTIIHEGFHWSGIGLGLVSREGYCEIPDCVTPCLTRNDADAWARYVDCLSQL